MNRDGRLERIPDPVLAAAMAELREENRHEIDWDGLRRTINDRAELMLARRRSRLLHRVPRPLLPIAAAAGIALLLWSGPALLTQVSGAGAPAELAAEIDHEQILIEALGSDLTEQEFRLLVTGRANPEALLAFAIGEP